ncbi:LOB domain-containing protein 23 [Cryptomeria japonica]|uniref:LOB domain-containing protein 23 n=1 Tax=Cryptomeria japonica TaxID=3369 RepID=UPI0027DA2C16|nr:LOB domain-containing protein 23 [Cryptomeria japonica]
MGSNINGNQLSSPTNQPCAACKHQRRRCTPECPLAPFFPPDQARRFYAAHKVYGVSNILKILNQLDAFQDKKVAVQSLCWDAECRIREPVYGCMAFYKRQKDYFRNELQKKQMEVEFYKKLLHSQHGIRVEAGVRNPQEEDQQEDFIQSNDYSPAQRSQSNTFLLCPQDHSSLFPICSSMEMVQPQAPPHYHHPHYVQQGIYLSCFIAS